MSNENSQVRFMAARTAEEYLADAHREVTPIAGGLRSNRYSLAGILGRVKPSAF